MISKTHQVKRLIDIIQYCDMVPRTITELANVLDEPRSTIKTAVKLLENVGLLEQTGTTTRGGGRSKTYLATVRIVKVNGKKKKD